MKTNGSSFSRLSGLVLLAIALPLFAQEDPEATDYQVGKALMEKFRYYDLAETIFDRLTKSERSEAQNLGRLGLSSLKRLAAQKEDDFAKRLVLNEEAINALRGVVEHLKKGSLEQYQTRFDLADLLQDVAIEAIDQINAGRVPVDQTAAVVKANENRLAEAEVIFDGIRGELASVDQDKEPEKYFLGARARLARYTLLYNKAELLGTDAANLKSPQREQLLTSARDGLGEYTGDYGGTLLEYYAWLWYGRVQAALFDAGLGGVKAEDAEEAFHHIYADLTAKPEDEDPDPDDPDAKPTKKPSSNWQPPEAFQDLAQRALWDLFKFENQVGSTGLCIETGKKFREDWKNFKAEYNLFGRLALNELAHAFHAEGQSAEALELAAFVSKDGGFAGQEADKTMSVIIRTAQNKQAFPPEVLAGGANGAYASRSSGPDKALEAIDLYQAVIANLDTVKDEDARTSLGRTAWYRVGMCYGALDRKLEAARAFEQGYRRYNVDKGTAEELDEKNVEKLMNNWRSVLNELSRDSNKTPFIRKLFDDANLYVSQHPPAVGKVSVDGLIWGQAESKRKAEAFDEAEKLYRQLAEKEGEYQERAMVRLAMVAYERYFKEKATTPEGWLEVAKRFDDYKAYAAKKPETDAAKLDNRKNALIEADFYIADCKVKAAGDEKDAAKAGPLFQQVLSLTEGFEARTKSSDLVERAKYNRFLALIGLKRGDDAELIFNALVKADPNSRVARAASTALGGLFKELADALPGTNDAELAIRQQARVRSARAYRVWLLSANSKKVSEWALVYKPLYDAEIWPEAYEILEKAIEHFSASKKDEKQVELMKRRQAFCVLNLAKISVSDGDTAKADEYFNRAAEVYNGLVGEDDKAPASVLEEAAEIFGGFLAGPDRRGNYSYYKGKGEFDRAANMWNLVERFSARKAGDPKIDLEERAALLRTLERAKFYKFLTAWQSALVKNDPTNEVNKIKKNLDALYTKTGGHPGGNEFFPKYEWLKNHM